MELKLHRSSEAFEQAQAHLEVGTEAYIGLPAEIAASLVSSPRGDRIIQAGVGVLAVSKSSCRVLRRSKPRRPNQNHIEAMRCIEIFWRDRLRDTSS